MGDLTAPEVRETACRSNLAPPALVNRAALWCIACGAQDAEASIRVWECPPARLGGTGARRATKRSRLPRVSSAPRRGACRSSIVGPREGVRII